MFHAYLPPVVRAVCAALREKTEATRETARAALVGVYEALGPRYFGFCVEELRRALGADLTARGGSYGEHTHVLGFTLHRL